MPELPEVETIRRQLAPAHGGPACWSRSRCWTRAGASPRAPARSTTPCAGRRIEAVGRRGKYFIVELEDEVHLVMHLRMTGQPAAGPRGGRRAGPPHLRARMTLDDGDRVLFVDQRRFGTGIVLLGTPALRRLLRRPAGVEPLGPGLHGRGAARAGARAAGAGEGVPAHPGADRRRGEHLRRRGAVPAPASTRCGRSARCKRPQLAALRDAVVESLEAGIDARGATIDDFRNADGAYGSFQDRFLVHLPRGRAVPALRNADPQDPGGGPGHLLLPEVPAAAAVTSRARAEAGERGSASSRPSRSASSSSRKPPIARSPDQDLREGHLAGEGHQLGAAVGVLGQVDLGVVDAAGLQQRLRLAAEAARLGGVERDPVLSFRHPLQSLGSAGYVQDRGGGAALDPVRRGRPRAAPLQRRSRPGRRDGQGRAPRALAPGRPARAAGAREAGAARGPGRPVHGHRGRHRARPRRRCASAASRSSARPQACDAVLRLFDSAEPNRPAYNLLCNQLALLDADPRGRHPRPVAGLPDQAAAGRRLRARAGLVRVVRRGASDLGGFSPARRRRGVRGCEAGSFPLGADGHAFLVGALARPLAEAPAARRAARWPRPTARSPRRSSTTRTCACAAWR